MRILIAGLGYIGLALADKLVDAGHEVVGLKRNVNLLRPVRYQVVSCDLAAGALDLDIGHIDAVVCLLAADEHTDIAYERTYVRAPKNLIALVKRTGVGAIPFIYVSSTAVYGQNDGSFVSEDSETVPKGFNGRRLLEGESISLQSEYRGIVMRFGGIYGPGRLWPITSVTKQGQGEWHGGSFLNLIHRDDCVGGLYHLIKLPDADGVFNGVDNEPVTKAVLSDWIAKSIRVPDREPSGQPIVLMNKRCLNRKLRDTGYSFQYPTFREGLAPLLAEFAVRK